MQKLAEEDKTDRRETSITTLYKDKIASSINNGIQDDANTKSSSNPSTLAPTPREIEIEKESLVNSLLTFAVQIRPL